MVKLLWRLRHLAAVASGDQEARCLPALLRADTRRNERTWRPVNTHSQRQSVSEMKDALSCPSPHIITLCNTLKYNKNFRGWGRGGGDPFLKGSLPHRAFPDSITPEHDRSRTQLQAQRFLQQARPSLLPQWGLYFRLTARKRRALFIGGSVRSPGIAPRRSKDHEQEADCCRCGRHWRRRP